MTESLSPAHPSPNPLPNDAPDDALIIDTSAAGAIGVASLYLAREHALTMWWDRHTPRLPWDPEFGFTLYNHGAGDWEWCKNLVDVGSQVARQMLQRAYTRRIPMWTHLDIRVAGDVDEANEVRLGLGGVRPELVTLDIGPARSVGRVLALLEELDFADLRVEAEGWAIVSPCPAPQLLAATAKIRNALRLRGIDLRDRSVAGAPTLFAEYDAVSGVCELVLFGVDDAALDLGAAVVAASARTTELVAADREAALTQPIADGRSLDAMFRARQVGS